MKRRDLLKGLLAGASALVAADVTLGSAVHTRDGDDAGARIAAIERRHGGRLGVAILDTGNGRRAAYRGDERFLMCSTFKLPLVAAVLARVDAGKDRLERRIVFGNGALLEWAPVTSKHVGAPGMTVAQLCGAAITLSDNTAANLLLQAIGEPSAVTRYLRGLGDPLTRLDRNEPTLNRWDGDKDTTSPSAMLGDMHRLLLGNALSDASRKQLTDWMLQSETGKDSLRAGLPVDWREGDKTGSGNTANNDVAILWPPNRKPLLVTAYYDNPNADVATRKVVLAEVGRVVASM